MESVSSRYKLFVLTVLLSLLSIPALALESVRALPLLQLGSGLRIVGIGHRGKEMIGSTLLLRNRSSKRIVGFEITFTAGGDERTDPNTKGNPQVIKRSGYFSVVLDPGEEYELSGQGPNADEVVGQLRDRGFRFGLVRVGVTRVVYSDGAEQNFDILKDEGTRRSEPPVDTGGQATVAPGKSLGRSGSSPALVKASLRVTKDSAEPCQVPRKPANSLGRIIPASVTRAVSPMGCNWLACDVMCLNPPACSEWTWLCNPDGAWDCDSRNCWTQSCIQ